MDPKPPRGALLAPPPHARMLHAPGTRGATVQAPAHDTGEHRRAHLPAVDDLTLGEDSRAEILDGEFVMLAMGANERRATIHFRLAQLLAAHVAEGYEGAVDMLTRTDHENEFAPDVSVFPTGRDPETGGRYLEELAFEIVDTSGEEKLTDKAGKLKERGVRRVFAIDVNAASVREWGRTRWRRLAAEGGIADVCLVRPLPLKALFDALAADQAVIDALLARKSPAMLEALAASEARGEKRGEERGRKLGQIEGLRESLVTVAAARALALTAAQRSRVARCDDPAALTRWLVRAVTAPTAEAIFGAG